MGALALSASMGALLAVPGQAMASKHWWKVHLPFPDTQRVARVTSALDGRLAIGYIAASNSFAPSTLNPTTRVVVLAANGERITEPFTIGHNYSDDHWDIALGAEADVIFTHRVCDSHQWWPGHIGNYSAVVSKLSADGQVTNLLRQKQLSPHLSQDGPLELASIGSSLAQSPAVKPNGDILFVDGRRIRRISQRDQTVATVAGGGEDDSNSALALKARFGEITALAVAPNGDVLVADQSNARLSRLSANEETVQTVADAGREQRFMVDIPRQTHISHFEPIRLAVDGANRIFVSHTEITDDPGLNNYRTFHPIWQIKPVPDTRAADQLGTSSSPVPGTRVAFDMFLAGDLESLGSQEFYPYQNLKLPHIRSIAAVAGGLLVTIDSPYLLFLSPDDQFEDALVELVAKATSNSAERDAALKTLHALACSPTLPRLREFHADENSYLHSLPRELIELLSGYISPGESLRAKMALDAVRRKDPRLNTPSVSRTTGSELQSSAPCFGCLAHDPDGSPQL